MSGTTPSTTRTHIKSNVDSGQRIDRIIKCKTEGLTQADSAKSIPCPNCFACAPMHRLRVRQHIACEPSTA